MWLSNHSILAEMILMEKKRNLAMLSQSLKRTPFGSSAFAVGGWVYRNPWMAFNHKKGNCYEAAKTSHLWNNMDVSTDSRWNLCMFVTWKSLVVSAWQMVNRNPLVTASKADGCRQRLRHPSTTIKVSPSHLPLTCSKIVPVMIPVRSVLPTINFYCYVS